MAQLTQGPPTEVRGLRRIGIVAAGLLALLLGIAAVLPPLWDWSRQRDTMEALASAALGRGVRIDGAVNLTLLPEPMLTASRVQVSGDADGGDLRIRSLRLGVALWPLLRGRVVARELVLRGPELRLPWPPTASILTLPAWYGGFAGRIEDGQIAMGSLSAREIQATLTTAEDGTLAISGRGSVAGQNWQLSARIGQPGRDGTATVDITLTGRERSMGHTAVLSGTLGGTSGLQGRLSIHGTDLSMWLPSPAMAFRAEGALRLGAQEWIWRDINLDLGGTPARGRLAMTLTPSPALQARLTAGRIDLDAWGAALWRLRNVGMPAVCDVEVEAGVFAGGTLRQLRGNIAVADGIVRLTDGQAVLPGEAALRLSGQMRWENDAPVIDGKVGLDTTDPRAGLRWLAGIFGTQVPNLPVEMVRTLSLSTDVAIANGQILLDNLAGQVDRTRLQGQVAIRQDPKPSVRMTLSGDQISLDPIATLPPPNLPRLLDGLGGAALDLQLQVQAVHLGGKTVTNLHLDSLLDPDRVLLRRLEGVADGARFTSAGSIDNKGVLADGKLEIGTDDAARLIGWLPPDWRSQQDFWTGRMLLRAEASGTMSALAMQVGMDLADGRLEAQPTVDLINDRVAGHMSLRHPNARRLLLSLLPGTQVRALGDIFHGWPGEGSLALQTQLDLRDGRLAFEGFDLTAGALRAAGRISAAWQNGVPRFEGRIMADTLPLPSLDMGQGEQFPTLFSLGWAGALAIHAQKVLFHDEIVLEKLVCDLTREAGTTRLSKCIARLAGGEARIEASLDGTLSPPILLTEIDIKDARLPEVPPDGRDNGMFSIRAERADLRLSLQGRGYSPAAQLASLSGPVRLQAWDGGWRGFDLSAARSALIEVTGQAAADRGTTGTAAALRAALSGGQTEFQQMELDGALDGTRLIIRGARSMSAAGDVRLSGQLGVDGEGLDLRIMLHPARNEGAADLPPLTLTLNGQAQAPGRVIDIGDALRRLSVPAP